MKLITSAGAQVWVARASGWACWVGGAFGGLRYKGFELEEEKERKRRKNLTSKDPWFYFYFYFYLFFASLRGFSLFILVTSPPSLFLFFSFLFALNYELRVHVLPPSPPAAPVVVSLFSFISDFCFADAVICGAFFFFSVFSCLWGRLSSRL